MHKVLLFYFIIFPFIAKSQQGEWTWVNGYNTLNGAGVFGTQGVPNANNKPPALWSAFYWTDNNGYFWLFGGLRNGSEYAALWKYDPQSNMWTWMKGPNMTSQQGVYGTEGVSSPANYPGSRAWGSCSWTDSNDNLWLFGGQGRDNNGDYGELGDVWKYNIATNQWTWVAGSKDTYPATVHGTLQLPAPANTPGGRVSTRSCWIDNSDNLWLFGGEGIVPGSQFSDVWKFDPSLAQWTWMKGPATTGESRVAGGVGVFGNSYTPGARNTFSAWKDQSGKFWLFGGVQGYSDYYADMWAFDPVTLQWAYMGGTLAAGADAIAGNLCEESTGFHPGNRYQNTACWMDQYGRFWQYGGFNLAGTSQDLWCFDPVTLQWTWASGSFDAYGVASYGIMGMADPSNIPYGSGGSAAWRDQSGNFWLYGGYTYYGANGLGDLWKFTPDLNCPEVEILPVELTQFQIMLVENTSVLVEWTTASEINSRDYTIEQSGNGTDFNSIKVIPGPGNSITAHQYSFIDQHPLTGINYYRIKQTDHDGQTTFTQVKSITVSSSGGVIISAQNPAQNPVSINLHFEKSNPVAASSLLIEDVYGRTLHQLAISGSKTMVLPYLSSGLYFIYPENDKNQKPFRLIVY